MSRKFVKDSLKKSTARPKVFIDTSVLLSALLSSRGGSFYILTQLKNKIELQINEFVLEETLKVLKEKFESLPQLKSRLLLLLGTAQVKILPVPKGRFLKSFYKIIEKDDASILASAILTSDYLVTLDRDFLDEKVQNFALKKNLLIVMPGGFVKRWRLGRI